MVEEINGFENEVWRDIEGYPGYQVSNRGRVKSFKRYNNGRMLYPCIGSKGYPFVRLYYSNGIKTVDVHRLVAYAFIPNQNGYPEVNHIDGDKTNNCVENLEWCTKSQNCKHRDILYPELRKGEMCGTSKLTNDQVLDIYHALHNNKASICELMEKYNMSQSAISSIKIGYCWSSVTHHSYTPIGIRKLSIQDARDIYNRAWSGRYSYSEIADLYGITVSAVKNIKKGHRRSKDTGHYNNK